MVHAKPGEKQKLLLYRYVFSYERIDNPFIPEEPKSFCKSPRTVYYCTERHAKPCYASVSFLQQHDAFEQPTHPGVPFSFAFLCVFKIVYTAKTIHATMHKIIIPVMSIFVSLSVR